MGNWGVWWTALEGWRRELASRGRRRPRGLAGRRDRGLGAGLGRRRPRRAEPRGLRRAAVAARRSPWSRRRSGTVTHRSADSEPIVVRDALGQGPRERRRPRRRRLGTAPSSPAATSTGSSSGSHSTSTTAPSGGQTGVVDHSRSAGPGTATPGLLTAECRSTSVSLVAAQPGTGYKVEIEERGPGRVLVKFEGLATARQGSGGRLRLPRRRRSGALGPERRGLRLQPLL